MGLLATLLMSVFSFVSCGDDDDDEGSGGSSNGSSSSKHIAKSVWSDGEKIVESVFSYDSQGRLAKMTETKSQGRYTDKRTTTYTYSELTIISMAIWDKDIIDQYHTYTLSDNLIIRDNFHGKDIPSGSPYTYTYNAEGYLTSIAERDGWKNVEFEWTNGNLTKWGRYSVGYSKIPWPKNWVFFWKGAYMDEMLEPLGVLGKMPKYLPNKFFVTDEGGDIVESWTVDYTIENGDITKVVYQGANGTEVYTYEWK